MSFDVSRCKILKIITKTCQGHGNRWLVVTTYLIVFNVVYHHQITFGNRSVQIQIVVYQNAIGYSVMECWHTDMLNRPRGMQQ